MRRATKQPQLLDRSILLHICLVELSTIIWYGVSPPLVGGTVAGTPLIARFIRGIFLSKQKQFLALTTRRNNSPYSSIASYGNM